MIKFIAAVKCKVDSIATRVGHGSPKQGVEGKLERGSPWVYPDDPLLAPIPDLHTHYLQPVFVCMWELLCGYMSAPPCPRCGDYQHVGVICLAASRVSCLHQWMSFVPLLASIAWAGRETAAYPLQQLLAPQLAST